MESVSGLTHVGRREGRGKGKSWVLPKPSRYQKVPQGSALLLQGHGALYNFTVLPPAEPWAVPALSLQICISSEQGHFESDVAWCMGALFDWFMPFVNLFSNLGNVLGVNETGLFPKHIKKGKKKALHRGTFEVVKIFSFQCLAPERERE